MSLDLGPVNVQPTRLAEIVFERIAGAILNGTFAPGAPVRDNAIATQLGVSRMPVREALQRLQRIGLIDMAASRYTRVAEVTPEMVAQTLEFAACQAAAITKLVVPQLDLRQARTVHGVIKDAITAIEKGAHPFAAAHGVYGHLAGYSGNRYMTELLADVDIAVQHNLNHASDSDAVRLHVRTQLVALDEAIAQGDAEAAARIAAAQHRIGDVVELTAAG